MTDNPKGWALVTGATSGIGAEFAHLLARKGYSILGVSNDESGLVTISEQLTRYDVDVRTFCIDLSEVDSAQAVHRHCNQSGINVEVLINNAGTLIVDPFLDVDPEGARQLLHLHITTPTLLARLVAGDMIHKRWGFILNVSSIAAYMSYPTISLYGPSKRYFLEFTRALRAELKPYGIHVTALVPGATDTPLLDRYQSQLPWAKRLGLLMRAESVAQKGLVALFKDRALCVPGIMNKAIISIVRLLPTAVVVWLLKPRNHKKG